MKIWVIHNPVKLCTSLKFIRISTLNVDIF